MAMELDLSPLERSVAALEQAVAEFAAEPQRRVVRAGLIQYFEFTYEVCHKTLKRFLESNLSSETDLDHLRFPDLIRTGNEQGLLRDEWPQWELYREMRNESSHAYAEEVALKVLSGIPRFLAEAQYLRDQLQRRCR